MVRKLRIPPSMTDQQAKELGRMYIRQMMQHDSQVKELVGKGFFGKFLEGLKEFGRGAAYPLKAIAQVGKVIPLPKEIRPVAFTGSLLSNVEDPQFAKDLGIGLKGKGKGKGSKAITRREKRNKVFGRVENLKTSQAQGDRRKQRAMIVKKIMQERGVKLGEASRIVKQEGLF